MLTSDGALALVWLAAVIRCNISRAKNGQDRNNMRQTASADVASGSALQRDVCAAAGEGGLSTIEHARLKCPSVRRKKCNIKVTKLKTFETI